MPKHEPVPPGHVLIRTEDLEWLLDRCRAPAAADAGSCWTALAVSVALVTSKLGEAGACPDDLMGEPTPALVRALAALAAAFGSVLPPDRMRLLLQDLGLLAAGQLAGTPAAGDGV